MTDVHETQLPGVGTRRDFVTREGERVGVIEHRSGRQDLLIYDRDDPDACRVVLHLSEDDGHVLANILGAPHLEETHDASKRQEIADGLVIDWLTVGDDWVCTDISLEDLGLRQSTGVLVAGVIRNGRTIPPPGPDFRLFPGDVAVVAGTPEGLRRAADLLETGAC